MDFEIVFDREEDGRWIAEIESLPGVLAYGATQTEARSKVEALALRVIPDQVRFAVA
jgi:predicted RNase H-like HicB family nuclease